jgi:hypothetical protein
VPDYASAYNDQSLYVWMGLFEFEFQPEIFDFLVEGLHSALGLNFKTQLYDSHRNFSKRAPIHRLYCVYFKYSHVFVNATSWYL